MVTMGTRHLSARTKLKCNSHFTIIIIVIMRHSLTFLQKLLLLFFFFLCSFANQSLPYFVWVFYFYFILFYHFLSLSVIGTPEGLLTITGVGCSRFCVVLVCVVLPAAQLAGKYRALTPHYHLHH